MKCHYPEVFACALLNAWPMGFYSPATIVEDARRHGIEVRPVDVACSDWLCTLEPLAPGSRLAIRMGLRYVKGLGEGDWQRIERARQTAPGNLAGFVRQTRLDEGALLALARSGAFRSLGVDRRAAIWQVSGTARVRARDAAQKNGGGLPLSESESEPEFALLDDFESIRWDYEASMHSTQGHPLEPYRGELAAMGLPDAAGLAEASDGSSASYAGMVICRQRPGTAGGVVFMTLEDETGFVNLVVWTRVFDRFRKVILTSSFLGVTGTIQSREGIVHLIVESCWKPQLARRPVSTASRDFH
jgi:error-prone DNA polymerase